MMRTTLQNLSLALATTAIVAATGFSTLAFSDDAPSTADLEDELRNAEMAFAATMADRDLEAFSSFLADEVVFFTGNDVMRGKDAVSAGWAPYFEGEKALFAWSPEAVSVLDSGELGLSSGPVFNPEGDRVGTFNSVWRRLSEGKWEIVFDKGCPPCECPE